MNSVLYARNDHPGILIVCPHCKMGVRHDSDDIGDAIRQGKPVVCVTCEKPFYVFVEVAPRVAVEQMRAADGTTCACPRVGGNVYHVVGCWIGFQESPRRKRKPFYSSVREQKSLNEKSIIASRQART